MPEASINFEREQSGPNEVFGPGDEPFAHYRSVLEEMGRMGAGGWRSGVERAHGRLLDVQRDLGVSDREDKTYPADYVPRVVSAVGWEVLESGLAQRMRAINAWLRRLEEDRDEVVPREVLESSVLHDDRVPMRLGPVPNRQMGFDMVAVEGRAAGEWEYLVIEDNAKMPVGIEPMHLLRQRTAELLPESYAALGVRPLDDLMDRFGETIRAASSRADPTIAVLTTGYDDQYYLDHNVFAREHGAILAERHEVELDRDGYLVHRGSGRRIDVIYERIESGRIYDDLPGLVESQAAGKVKAIFDPNLGIADDKGVYPFVPEMIRTYLSEEPILQNLKTYSLAVEEDRRHVMDNFDRLVVKSRSGWGGKGVLIAPEESRANIREFREQVEKNPVEFVAQDPVDFSTHVLCATEEDRFLLRDSYADLRVHALAPDEETVWVVPGAMTRVAAPGSRLVNVSSGGRTKDTWVLE